MASISLEALEAFVAQKRIKKDKPASSTSTPNAPRAPSKPRARLPGEHAPFVPQVSVRNLTPPRHECQRAGPDLVAPDLLPRLVKAQHEARIQGYISNFLLNILAAE